MTFFHVNARYFNTIAYDASSNRVTKRSKDAAKLRNEIEWYLHVPQTIQRYLPEIIDYSLDEDDVFITMACIRLPTAHDLYMEQPDSEPLMNAIYRLLQTVLSDFSSHKATVSKTDLEDMYIHKTLQRLTRFLEQCGWARQIYRRGSITVNGRQYPCPIRLIEKRAHMLYPSLQNPIPRIIHGDLCFSNLFVDVHRGGIVMIDPRGSFGTPGIYGDGRYDLAKVRHSLTGYDHIIADRFMAELVGDRLAIELPRECCHLAWQAEWDELCSPSRAEVRLIEALLFLSMIELHADKPLRQLAMYGLGTQLLFHTLWE